MTEITMKFLEGRLKQAESDVAMYATMLDEIRKLQNEKRKVDSNVRFLTVLTTKETV